MKLKSIILAAVITLGLLVRVVSLESFPAGLNADEAAIGYNAWSLINTGKDEHGASWPLVFRSFDDYKPPIYFYLVLPFVYFLDLTVLAVRLPSAIMGSISIWLVYLLAQRPFCQSHISFLGFSSCCSLLAVIGGSQADLAIYKKHCYFLYSWSHYLHSSDLSDAHQRRPISFYWCFSLLRLWSSVASARVQTNSWGNCLQSTCSQPVSLLWVAVHQKLLVPLLA